MSAHLRPALAWTLEGFLDRERPREERWALDGVGPVATTGGTVRRSLVGTLLLLARATRPHPLCQAFRGDVKVQVAQDRIRHPDAVVSCADPLPEGDAILPAPVAALEVPSPENAAVDRSVKAAAYVATPSIRDRVTLERKAPRAAVRRREGEGWVETTLEGAEAALAPAEIGVAALPLAEACGPARGV